MRFSYTLMFLLIFFYSVYAIETPVGTIEMPADFTEILAAGMIGVSIGMMFAALGYMLGNLFGFPQMIGWSKNQLWESIYTMVLVSSVLIFAVVVHLFPVGVPEALATTTNISFPEKAAMSLDNVINGEIDLANLPPDYQKEFDEEGFITTGHIGVKRLFYISYVDQLFLGVAYNIFRLEFSSGIWKLFDAFNAIFADEETRISGHFLSGFKKLMGLSGTVSNYLLSLLLILYAQMGLLVFISGGAVFIFSFGVFFRCIPFTRKLGSTLIALFIVLYFVYPAFIIFLFSEDMYGRMSKEFEGMYVQDNWFTGMEGIDPSGIVILEPFGLNQISPNPYENEVFLRFHSSMFPEYNYTVQQGNNVICIGSDINLGDMVECDLTGTIPPHNTLINPNLDKFNDNIEDAITKLEFKDVGTSVEYTIHLRSYNGSHTLIYPPQPLPFKVYYSQQCTNDLCFQRALQLSHVLQDSVNSDVKAELLGPMREQLEKGYPEGKIADVAIGATKGILFALGTKFSGGKASMILVGFLFKNDISGFFYDEMTCDPYTNMIATKYFDVHEHNYPTIEEEGKSSSFDFINEIRKLSLDEITDSLKEKTTQHYGKSDYMSCTNALGYQSGSIVSSLVRTFGGGTGWTSKHLSVIFAPIVYTFIGFIYTMVFCITFFKSLSESIGGDPSLMGLGKLL